MEGWAHLRRKFGGKSRNEITKAGKIQGVTEVETGLIACAYLLQQCMHWFLSQVITPVEY